MKWYKTNLGILINLSQVHYIERVRTTIFIGYSWAKSEFLEDTYDDERGARIAFKNLSEYLKCE